MHKAQVKCTWGRASSPFLVAWLETCKNWDFLASKTVRNKLPSLISHPYYGIPNRLEQTTLRQQPEWFTSSISHPKIILFIDLFPDSSVGKVSSCIAGDPSLIPGVGRSPGEGIGYPLQYFWASLVAQLVKNLPAIRETWARPLVWDDPLEKAKGTHSNILAWRLNSPWCHKESDTTEWPSLSHFFTIYIPPITFLVQEFAHVFHQHLEHCMAFGTHYINVKRLNMSLCVAFEMYFFFHFLKYNLPCWWLDKALFHPKKKSHDMPDLSIKVKVKVKLLSRIVDKK